MSFMRNLFLLLFCPLLFIGCATNMKDQFDQVKVGMEKNDVLGLMDSPQRTQRWKGMDRWTYIFYDKDMRIEKEVHFAEGKAAYVGEVYKPAVSAEQQDAINEASNAEIEAKYQALREENKKNFGNMNGPEGGGADDSPRYVPQFEPVQ